MNSITSKPNEVNTPKTRNEYMMLAEAALSDYYAVLGTYEESVRIGDYKVSNLQFPLLTLAIQKVFALATLANTQAIAELTACFSAPIKPRFLPEKAGIPEGATSCAIFADTEQEHENLLSTADAALQWFDENAHLDIPAQMVDDLRAAIGGNARVKPRPDVNADLLTSLQCATRVLRFVRDGDNISREAIASHVEVFEGIITIAEQGGSTP